MQNLVALDELQKNKDIHWSRVLQDAFRDPMELLKFLELDSQNYLEKIIPDHTFKMLVPHSFAMKMKKGDWDDPLLKQVLPIVDEDIDTPGFITDPVGDLNAEISAGLLHKYHGRVLLVTTGACAVHCRYCFRKEFPYASSRPDKAQWEKTLSKISVDHSINEVILSGGDPLMISDDRLMKMCEDLSAIPHVDTLRFHSRVPVFLPERITESFLARFSNLQCNKVMVIHSNHAAEIDEKVGGCLKALKKAEFSLLNQTVLLKNINDNVEVLARLNHRLFQFGVLPYYLHQLDRVKGTKHFEVDKNKSIQIVRGLRNILPGYLVPKLVGEVSGKRSKQAIE